MQQYSFTAHFKMASSVEKQIVPEIEVCGFKNFPANYVL